PLIKKEEATSSGRPHSAKFIGKNLFVDEDVLFNNLSQLPEIKELSYKTSLVLPRVLELMEPEGVEVKPAVVEDPSDSQLDQGQKEVQDDHEQALKRSVAGNQCQQRVVEFFGDEANKDLVNNYIKIQSKIALHRVAWTYLKSSQGDTKNFEASIKELLLKRDPKLHEKFVNSKQFSRNERLLAVMSELKDASSEFETKKDEPYTIKYSDVKMIDLLVEAENQHGRSYDNGIMDFTSIIRNSMKSRLNTKDANIGKIEAQLDILESKKDKLDEQLMSYLSKFNCDEQVDFGACGPKNIKSFDIGKGLEEFEALIDSVYEKQFEKSKELKNNFRWNTYWLHVR
ncbi:MAG: hypothetical protein KC478_06665, partial [Bacteriovoracaceae bacterium]|nr:hypothetical protein [Bacteriovoracaceae bacterium]